MPANNKKAKIIKKKVQKWICEESENIERDIEKAFRKILKQPTTEPKNEKIKKQILQWLSQDSKSKKIRSTVLEWSGKLEQNYNNSKEESEDSSFNDNSNHFDNDS